MGTMVLIRRLGAEADPELLAFSLIQPDRLPIVWGRHGQRRGDRRRLRANRSHRARAAHQPHLSRVQHPVAADLPAHGGARRASPDRRERASEALWLLRSSRPRHHFDGVSSGRPAMLAAFGPAIVLRYLIDEKPTARRSPLRHGACCHSRCRSGWLALTRPVPRSITLKSSWSIPAFRRRANLGAVVPRRHLAGRSRRADRLCCTAISGPSLRDRSRRLGRPAGSPCLPVIVFSMMAERAVALGHRRRHLARRDVGTFGVWSVTVTPMISAVFGALANSGDAANGLSVSSQLSPCDRGPASTSPQPSSLQHAAALSLNMVSPVRMSIVPQSRRHARPRAGRLSRDAPFVAVIARGSCS